METRRREPLIYRPGQRTACITMIETTADKPDLKSSRRRPSSNGGGAHRADRLPPHSPEAEQGVLGCIFLSPNDCMGECITKLNGGSEVFYDLRNQTVFDVLAEMFDKREGIDLITVQQRLKDRQLLEQGGGVAYLSTLPDAVPSAANSRITWTSCRRSSCCER